MLQTPLADVATVLSNLGLQNIKTQIDQYVISQGPGVLANLVGAALTFVVGRWAVKLADRLIQRMFRRSKIDETLSKFLARIAYAVLMTAVVLATLDRIGVNTTSLAAIMAATGLAIGMALQGSLANFAAGVVLILLRPFKVGDFIEAAGTKGVVEEIHLFSTMMRTGDNAQVIVPNSAITSQTITNFSTKKTRRIDLIVGCGYDDDLQAVKRFLLDVVAKEQRVLRDPEPVVAVAELAESSVNFVVRPWVASGDYWPVRWALIEQIKLGFDEHGFEIPLPQHDVHLHAAEAANVPHPTNAAEAVPSRGGVQPRRVA